VIFNKKDIKPGTVARVCGPSYPRGEGANSLEPQSCRPAWATVSKRKRKKVGGDEWVINNKEEKETYDWNFFGWGELEVWFKVTLSIYGLD
jgi:hypothetical protein